MKTSSTILLALTGTALTGTALAQGPLTAPPGIPGPEMKSFQQIWDKIGGLETQVAAQQATIQQQTMLITTLTAGGTTPDWIISNIAGQAEAQPASSLAFSPSGAPAVCYTHRYPSPSGNDNGVVFMEMVQGSWIRTTIDEGTGGSLTFAPDGSPVVAYVKAGRIYYAARTAGAWQVELVSTVPLNSTFPELGSVAFSPAGNVGIAYQDPTSPTTQVYVVEKSGAIWGAPVAVPNPPGSESIALNQGRPRLAYHSDGTAYVATGTQGLVFLATRTGEVWNSSVVAGLSNIPSFGHPGLAIAPSGTASLIFGRSGGNPKFTSAPTFTISDAIAPANGLVTLSKWASVAYSPTGQLGYAFHANVNFGYNTNGQSAPSDSGVRFAKAGERGSIVALGDSSDISLAFAPNGKAWIIFYDATGDRVRLAVQNY